MTDTACRRPAGPRAHAPAQATRPLPPTGTYPNWHCQQCLSPGATITQVPLMGVIE